MIHSWKPCFCDNPRCAAHPGSTDCTHPALSPNAFCGACLNAGPPQQEKKKPVPSVESTLDFAFDNYADLLERLSK